MKVIDAKDSIEIVCLYRASCVMCHVRLFGVTAAALDQRAATDCGATEAAAA